MIDKIEIQVKKVFEKLGEEGHHISLVDCRDEGDGEVWVAYVLHPTHDEVITLKKYLDETGKLLEPADDIIEDIDELYSELKKICKRS